MGGLVALISFRRRECSDYRHPRRRFPQGKRSNVPATSGDYTPALGGCGGNQEFQSNQLLVSLASQLGMDCCI